MEERRVSMEAYKKVHNETVRSGLAYEEDKRREELNQKIEEVINLIQSFIQNPISPVKTPQTVTTNVSSKLVQNTPRFEENSGKSYTCSDEVKNELKNLPQIDTILKNLNSKDTDTSIGAPESANNQDKRSMTWAGDQSQLECPVEFALRSFEGLHYDLGKGQERRTWNPGIIHHQSRRIWNTVFQHFELLADRHAKGAVQRRVWDPGITHRGILEQHLKDKVFLRAGVL
ncbi:hypothetical protein Tco_1575260 [Tanacetum coccineum]